MPAVTSDLPRQHAAPGPNVVPARRRHTWRTVLMVNGIIALVVTGLITGVLWSVTSAFQSVERIPFAFPPDISRPPVATGEAAQALNFLVLGSDNRGASGSMTDLAGQHSDTIVVVHVPADRSALSIMSIPRDVGVDVPGAGQTSISAALSVGGVPLAVQTVEGVVGVRMDHVALVDFAGFKAVTDALGGVNVDNPIAFDSYYLQGRYFPAGPQHLNGAEALAFARERAAFRDGDLQRVRNQQQLINALIGGLLQAETLTDPGKIGAVIGAVTPHLAIDENLTSGDLAALGVAMRDVRTEDVAFFTIPTAGLSGRSGVDGHAIVNLDSAALPAVQEGFRTDTLGDVVPGLQAAG
jgi:LCP family protein required for cell wall assembly